jgi:hypothetical protein
MAPVVVRLASTCGFMDSKTPSWPYSLISRSAPTVSPLWEGCDLLIMRSFRWPYINADRRVRTRSRPMCTSSFLINLG